MTKMSLALNDTRLDEVSGGEPNLGGYVACNNPGTQEGLYSARAGCPRPPATPGWDLWLNMALGIRARMG